MEDDFREAEFYLDIDPERTFFGYTKGDTWNGWACPYFEREVAEEVSRAYVEVNESGPEEGYEAEYDPERDAFLFYEPAYDEPLEFEAIEVGDQKLYPIGAYYWTWRQNTE